MSRCAITASSHQAAAYAWLHCGNSFKMLFQIALNLVMQNKVKSLRLQRLPRSYADQVMARLCAFSNLFNLLDAAHHEPVKFPRDTSFHPGRQLFTLRPWFGLS
ncbi:MAG: hypothetical protein MUO64_02785 [Anaerolineales bacterium]|nr:hypothetical protein [Anaerolineales bacterium]